MDRSEKLARDYLISQGYSPIYEPRGVTTCPDFEINKTTAIEVRRLNENYYANKKNEGLRTVSQPLWDGIESIFATHQEQNPKLNYWVSLHMKRPVEKLKFLKKKLNQYLGNYSTKDHIQDKNIKISSSISLELRPKTKIENQIFHLGSMLDFDSGGYVLPILLQNMNFCIEQKTKKITPCYCKYEKWWLILIDEISYGLNHKDKQYVSHQIIKKPTWERIITLNTLNGKEILKI
jgi:hypothetical protein